jgi:hypothetical protein
MSELRLRDLRLVGDELHFDGVLVAMLTTTCSATELSRFTDLVEYGEPEEEDCDCPPRPPRLHKRDCACYRAEDGDPGPTDAESCNDVMRRAKQLARGGLVRLVDLEKEFGK